MTLGAGLVRGLLRGGVDTCGRKFKANEPGAGDAVAGGFGAGELPLARGLFGEAGKILTGARRIKFRADDIPRCVHLNFHKHMKRAMNGVERFLRRFGQDFIQDFAAADSFAG